MKIQKLIPVFVIIVALIFAVLSLYLPWWSVRTATEAEMVLNATARSDYQLLQTVSASRTFNNETQTVSVVIGNLTKNAEDRNALVSAFNITFTLLTVGLALSILSLALIIISILKKPLYKFAFLGAVVAAILLCVAPIYLTSTIEPLIPKLDSVMPIDIPPKWISIKPQDVTSFWGSIQIPKSIDFPVWVRGENFWIWGAASGWFLTFTAGLLLFVSAILVNYGIPKE